MSPEYYPIVVGELDPLDLWQAWRDRVDDTN